MATIGLSTYSFGPDCEIDAALDFAVEHGFKALELSSYHLWPARLKVQDVRRLRMQGAQHEIQYSIHFIHRGVAPASHDSERRAKHLDELTETMHLAHEIGARVIVVHPGLMDHPDIPSEESPEPVRQEAIAQLEEFLRNAAPVADDTGTVLCVENLFHKPGYVIQTYRELAELIERVAHPLVKITLDTGHARLSDGLAGAFQAFGSYLRHIHIHDSDVDQDHLEFGTGNENWSEHVSVLQEYPFTITMEVVNEADPEGCAIRSGQALRALLAGNTR
jgi:sugar phosphate isomerase/epimerase